MGLIDALSYQIGRKTAQVSGADLKGEAKLREPYLKAISELEKLRAADVRDIRGRFTDEEKAIIQMLTDAMSATAEAAKAGAMSQQALADALRVYTPYVEQSANSVFRVADPAVQKEANAQGQKLQDGLSNYLNANAQSVNQNIDRLGGMYVTGADGKRALNAAAVDYMADVVNQYGGQNAVAAMISQVAAIDPAKRADSAVYADQQLTRAVSDGFAAGDIIGKAQGMTAQDRAAFGAAVGHRMNERMARALNMDEAAWKAATVRDTAYQVHDNLVADINKLGSVDPHQKALLLDVLDRSYAQSQKSLASASIDSAYIQEPYFDARIKDMQEGLQAVDARLAKEAEKSSDPIYAAIADMRAKVPAFDTFQRAMRFPNAEKAAMYAARYPSELKMFNDAAKDNVHLLNDVELARRFLRDAGVPVTPIERMALSGRPNSPVVAGNPSDGVVGGVEDVRPESVEDMSDEELSRAMPLEGQMSDQHDQTEDEALDEQADSMADLSSTASVDATPGQAWEGQGGYSYKVTDNGDFEITGAPTGSKSQGFVVSKEANPEMWQAVEDERQQALGGAEPPSTDVADGSVETKTEPAAADAAPTESTESSPAPAPAATAEPPVRIPAREREEPFPNSADGNKQPASQPTSEKEKSPEERRAAFAARFSLRPPKEKPTEPSAPAQAQDAPDAQAGPVALTNASPAAVAAGTSVTPPATIAGYGAGRFRDAAMAANLRRRMG